MDNKENVTFREHFLNMDLSLNIVFRPFKFWMCILEIQIEGTFLKFLINVLVFILLKVEIQVIKKPWKFQLKNFKSNWDITVQKMNVKKISF